MSSAPAASPNRVFHGPHDSEDGRALYQGRIALLNRVVFLLSFGFWAFGAVALFLALGWRPLATASHGLHLASALVAGAVWLVARRGTLSATTLVALDVGSMVTQSLAYAAMAIVDGPSPASRGDLVVTLILMTISMTRAVLVPSTARRTAAIGVATMLPLFPVAYNEANLFVGVVPAPHAFAFLSATLWSAVTIVVTSLASRVIYGLRREVEVARRLGQYTLEEKIGEGGMGEVYKARHALLRRPTAIKLLRGERTGDQTLARFEREVQLTSQLTHPNTIAIYDYGHTPDGAFYYAMEYLDGVTLEDLVDATGPQPPARVVHVLLQVCGALREAHAAGLVHRDIKPPNIMLTSRGGVPDFVKVLDFGLVKEMIPEGSANVTHANAILGTPYYMAPESILDPPSVDARADIYALGATAFFMLTATMLFDGANMVAIFAKHLHEPPPKPSSKRPDIPESLEKIVLACLAKRADDRPKDAAALAELLRAADAPAWTEADAIAWWANNAERCRPRSSAATSGVRAHSGRITVAVDAR